MLILQLKIVDHKMIKVSAENKEHIFKMVSAFSGLLSAFTGTVFLTYQPYSHFLPSVFGMLIIVIFISTFKLNKVTCLV